MVIQRSIEVSGAILWLHINIIFAKFLDVLFILFQLAVWFCLIFICFFNLHLIDFLHTLEVSISVSILLKNIEIERCPGNDWFTFWCWQKCHGVVFDGHEAGPLISIGHFKIRNCALFFIFSPRLVINYYFLGLVVHLSRALDPLIILSTVIYVKDYIGHAHFISDFYLRAIFWNEP